MKFYVLRTTSALEDNFSVVSLDVTSIHSSFIPGQFENMMTLIKARS